MFGHSVDFDESPSERDQAIFIAHQSWRINQKRGLPLNLGNGEYSIFFLISPYLFFPFAVRLTNQSATDKKQNITRKKINSANLQTNRQTDRQAYRQAGGLIVRQTNRQVNRQTDKPIGRLTNG
jgi:hypothetical protein